MSTVLLAWELGGGMGHLLPHRELVCTLLQRGHVVHVASRDVGRAGVAFEGLPLHFWPVPLTLDLPKKVYQPTVSFPQILHNVGFANVSDGTGNQYVYQTPVGLPTVSTVSPGTATTSGGSTITITGTGFTNVSAVDFGSTPATSFTVVSSTSITAVTPSEVSGTVNVEVVTAYGTSTANSGDQLTFTTPVLAPTVTGISSSSGSSAGGNSLTLLGTNFTNVTGINFGTVACTNYTVNSSTSITAVVPAGTVGTVNITVTNSGGTSGSSSSSQYTYQSSNPTVTGLSTTSGYSTGGTAVAIVGTNFSGVTGVKFGTVAATSFSLNSPTSITAYSPAETLGTVDVTVQSSSGSSATSSADKFQFVAPAPGVTGLSVSSGVITGGTSVVISGTQLSSATGVLFGSVAASSFTVNANGTITAVSAAESVGTVNITVSNSSGVSPTTSADLFTFTNPPPVLTGLSVTSGSTMGGGTITLTGSRFTGSTSVSFGSVAASSYTVENDNTILVTVPADSAGVVNVTVTNPAGVSAVSSADQYTYLIPLPSVTGLSVSSGTTAGGTSVTISGSNFSSATAVLFGSVAASSYSINANGTISAVTPAEAAGIVNVTIRNSSGTSATTSADQFTFTVPITPPVVTGLSVTTGVDTGGASVTISGSHFTGASAVLFGTVPAASFTVSNDGSILAVSPAETAGIVNVTVTNGGGTSSVTSVDQFTLTVPPPVVTGLSTATGSTGGGTPVTISGSHFTGATEVLFGSVPASAFTVVNDTTISVVAPAVAAGTVNVTVVTGSGTSPTSAADQITFQTTWSSGSGGGPTTPNASGAPVIDGLDNTGGTTSGGGAVAIYGVGFKTVTGVKFGSVPAASFTVVSDNLINAVAPAQSAGSVNITLQSPAGASVAAGSNQFTVTAANAVPSVTGVALSPNSNGAGSMASIQGSNFTGIKGVTIGGVPAVYTVISPTTMLAVIPLGVTGSASVSVTNGNGSSQATGASQINVGSSNLTPAVTSSNGVSSPAPNGDYVVPATAGVPSFNPSSTFSGTTGPMAAASVPYVNLTNSVTTSTVSNGSGGAVTTETENETWPNTNVITQSNGAVETITTTATLVLSYCASYGSSGYGSSSTSVDVSQTLSYGISDTLVAANGTGFTKFTSEVFTESYQGSTSNGTTTFSSDDLTTVTTSDIEQGPSIVNGTDTETVMLVQSNTTDVSSSGTTTAAGITSGEFNNSGNGNDNYNDADNNTTASNTSSDALTGSDQWGGDSSGTFTVNPNGSDVASDTYNGFSSGNDNYNDTDTNTSTTVTSDADGVTVASGSTTVFDVSTTGDAGFDEYNFSGDGTLSLAANGTISSTDNHSDTDSGNEDQTQSDSGWQQSNDVLTDGTVVSYDDQFGDSFEDKSNYSDGDQQNASTATGGTDDLTDASGDNDKFNSTDNVTETATLTNSYGTPTVSQITDTSGDKGTMTDGGTDSDDEVMGTGESDQDDPIQFSNWDQEQDTATDNLTVVTTTNGQVGPGETLNSTETFTSVDTSPESDQYNDSGADNVLPTSYTEGDDATDTSTSGDQDQLEDKLVSTDTLTQSDGTVVTTTVNNDDKDQESDSEADVTGDNHTDVLATGASTDVANDDDTYNDQYTETDNYSQNDNVSQTVAIPVAGGGINLGDTAGVTDTGTGGENDTDIGEDNTANSSADSETDSTDLTNTDQGTDTCSDSLSFIITDPTTGEVTTITGGDSGSDQFTNEDEFDVSDTMTADGASLVTQTGSASVDSTDNFTDGSNLSVSVLGSPSPGATVSYLDSSTATDAGGDSDDNQDDITGVGSDSGTDTFGSSNSATFSDSGHDDSTLVASTNDGQGNTTSNNDSDMTTFGNSGTVTDSDTGTETYSDAGGTPTSGNETDTDVQGDTLNPSQTETTSNNDTTASIDPTTGLTTSSTYIASSSNALTEQDLASFTDVHSQSLTNPGSDATSGVSSDTGSEVTSDSLNSTVNSIGQIAAGEVGDVTNTYVQVDNCHETYSDSAALATDGTITDTSTVTGTTNTPTMYDTEFGTMSTTDPSTGNQISDSWDETVGATLHDTQTYVDTNSTTSGGEVTDSPSITENGTATVTIVLQETITTISPGGSSISSQTSNVNLSDTGVSTNGVISDQGTVDNNAPPNSPPSSADLFTAAENASGNSGTTTTNGASTPADQIGDGTINGELIASLDPNIIAQIIADAAIGNVGLTGVGHHWVPQSLYEACANIIDDAALKIFKVETKLPDFYNHAYDTWGPTHDAYNAAVKKLLNYVAGTSATGKIDGPAAQEIVKWISSGNAPANVTTALGDSWTTIAKWRTGFMTSLTITAAAHELAPGLGTQELKAIAWAKINPGKTMPPGLAKAYKTKAVQNAVGEMAKKAPALMGKVAKKVLPGVLGLALSAPGVVGAAQNGAAGNNPLGATGAAGAMVGAGDQMAQDLVMKDIVETAISMTVIPGYNFLDSFNPVNSPTTAKGRQIDRLINDIPVGR